MEFKFRVLIATELDAVTKFQEEFEKNAAEALNITPEQAMLMSWNAPWRRESLEHYARSGWSFAAWDGDRIAGYFLAQPFVFFRGLTQTLWVEYLAARDATLEAELIDLARRYGRDKHLQSVLFAENTALQSDLQSLGAQLISDRIFEFKTTKAVR